MNNDKKKGAAGLIVALLVAVAALAGIVFLVLNTIQQEKGNAEAQVITASTAETVADSTLSSADESTVAVTESSAAAVEVVSGAEIAESTTESAESAEGPTAREKELMDASVNDPHFWDGAPKIIQEFLTINPYSRCADKLDGVHDIVIHYVGNPGTTAAKNVEYFESLQDGSASASSTFVIGLDGEIIQCLPTDEWSYATKQRNHDTLSIEVCHPDESGKFNDASYWAAVDLTAFLCKAFEIGPDHVIRHYDVTGKICPKYYVEHPEAWDEFKQNVKARYDYLVSLD